MLLLVHFAFSWFSSLWDPLAVDTVDIWERICTIYRSEHPSKWWKMFDVHSTILELLQHRCTQGESAAETKVAEASCWWCKQSCVWLCFYRSFPAVSTSSRFPTSGNVCVLPYDCMYSMSVFWIFYTILQLFHMLRAFALVLEVNSSLLVIADSIYH